jgi:hypothetical protein
MAIIIKGIVDVCWVPDGSGPEFVPSAQTLSVALGYGPLGTQGTGLSSVIVVPGGNAPSTGNVSTAMTAFATAIAALLNTTANNGTINGWAAGNP